MVTGSVPGMDPFELPDSADGLLGDGGLLRELERWAADARVRAAAEQRSRERWLRRQATEDATLTGVLTDLAERGASVVLATRSGRRHRGRIHALGVDFCALEGEAGRGQLVRLDAITTVRTLPSERVVTGDRTVELSLRLADVLLGLAADRPSVLIGTDTDETARGELRAVGTDVVTIRGDGSPPATVYVPIDAVSEVALH